MNLLKKDIKNIVYRSITMFIIYFILLVACEIYFIRFNEYNPIEVFFMTIVIDGGYIAGFESFISPIFWFLLQLVPTFIVSFSIYSEYVQNSSYDILKTRSRFKYFVSKVLAGLIIILFLNLCLYILVIINAYLSNNMDIEYLKSFTRLIFSYFMVEFILFLISFNVFIIFGYKFGITTILIQLMLSMTTNFKYFIGQQSLLYKQDMMGGYITMKDNLITWGVYLIILILTSYFIYSKHDFYGGSND